MGLLSYLEAPAAAAEGVHTVSIDEMTGMQALERAAPSLPMKPGKVERREFEYIRHGTQTLIAAFDVATGKVQGAVGDSRTEADFVAFLERMFATDGHAARWKIICDNLNTHLSESAVRLVARLSGVDEDPKKTRPPPNCFPAHGPPPPRDYRPLLNAIRAILPAFTASPFRHFFADITVAPRPTPNEKPRPPPPPTPLDWPDILPPPPPLLPQPI